MAPRRPWEAKPLRLHPVWLWSKRLCRSQDCWARDVSAPVSSKWQEGEKTAEHPRGTPGFFFKCDSGVSNNKCGGLGGEGSHGKWEKIWRKSGTASLMLKGIYVSYASLLFVIVWDNTFVHIQINCHPRFRQLTNSIFFSQLIRQLEIKPDPTLGELKSISRTVLIPDKQLNLHFVDRR